MNSITLSKLQLPYLFSLSVYALMVGHDKISKIVFPILVHVTYYCLYVSVIARLLNDTQNHIPRALGEFQTLPSQSVTHVFTDWLRATGVIYYNNLHYVMWKRGEMKCYGSLCWVPLTKTWSIHDQQLVSTAGIVIDSLCFTQDESFVWNNFDTTILTVGATATGRSLTWRIETHAVIQCNTGSIPVLSSWSSDWRQMKEISHLFRVRSTCHECVSVHSQQKKKSYKCTYHDIKNPLLI